MDTINRIREEWSKSEVSERVNATEMFAINHGFEEWRKPTIPDWWLSHRTKELTDIVEWLEGMKKEIVEPINSEGLYRGLEVMKQKVDESYNQALSDIQVYIKSLIGENKI